MSKRAVKNQPEENQSIGILRQGAHSQFWGLLVEVLEQNIEVVIEAMRDDSLKDLPGDRYKLEMEILKSKEKYLRELIDMPDTLSAWLASPENDGERFKLDPFKKPSEFI